MRRDAFPLPEAGSLTGTVTWFSEPRGYGFITLPSGPSVYVHHSAIEMDGFRTLRPGMKVAFELEEGAGGPRARHVVLNEPR
jgi:cold shock protein